MRKSVILHLAFLSFVVPELIFSHLVCAADSQILSKIKGNVQIKRSHSTKFQAAKVNDRLSSSDVLKLESGASAIVTCSNANIWIVPPGRVSSVSEGCPSTEPSKRNIISPRSSNQNIPYIISPRNTTVRRDSFLVRWNKVEGATSYTVQIRGGGLKWETQTSNTEIVYSGGLALQPGQSYFVVVTTDKGISSAEGVANRFEILNDEKVQLLEAKSAQLKQQGLTPEAENLALANLYSNYNLKAEAIALLEEMVNRGSQSMAVYELLGDLYWEIGLTQLAKQPYLKAWELAKQSEDTEGQAAIEADLVKIEFWLGNKNESKGWFEKAKTNYTALRNVTQLQQLEEWLNINFDDSHP